MAPFVGGAAHAARYRPRRRHRRRLRPRPGRGPAPGRRWRQGRPARHRRRQGRGGRGGAWPGTRALRAYRCARRGRREREPGCGARLPRRPQCGGQLRRHPRSVPMPLEGFTGTVMVNLVGSFNVAKAAAALIQHNPPGEDGERGVIVNTASVAAFEGQIGQAAYAASKGGVVGMTLPMARELARLGIRVMTIAPGVFWTPMVDGMPQSVQDSLAATIPFPARLGQPEEFADTVAFILRTRYLNGGTIRL